jgi:hypothetical protein
MGHPAALKARRAMLNQLIVGLALFLVPALPPLLMAGALTLDGVTGRGYGLVLFAVVVLGAIMWLTVTLGQPIEHATLGTLAIAGAFSPLFFASGVYLVLWLWGGALLEARAARQWGWVVLLVVAGVLPILNLLENNTLHLGTQGTAIAGSDELSFLLLLPALAVLIYGLVRIVRPVAPRVGAVAG